MKTWLAFLIVVGVALVWMGCTQHDGMAGQAPVAPSAQLPTAAADQQPADEAPATPAVKEIEPAQFDGEVLKSDLPVVVDFFATWCGPCKRLAPVLDQVAAERAGKAKFVRLDVDKGQELAGKYGIEGVPTLILFVKGEQKAKWVGYREKAEILTSLDAALK